MARLGSGRAIELAVTLAESLQSRGHGALARAALDRAALCAVARVRETDRVVREIPELAFVTDEDRALLSGVLRRFGGQHRDLLTSLATLFERAHAAGESWLADLRTGTQVVICAWCTRVRSAAGHWVPIGHYVPEETPLPLSHGACVADLRSTYAD